MMTGHTNKPQHNTSSQGECAAKISYNCCICPYIAFKRTIAARRVLHASRALHVKHATSALQAKVCLVSHLLRAVHVKHAASHATHFAHLPRAACFAHYNVPHAPSPRTCPCALTPLSARMLRAHLPHAQAKQFFYFLS